MAFADTIEIEIDDDLYEQLERLAEEEGLSVQELAEKIVRDYLDEVESPPDIYNDQDYEDEDD